MWKLPDGKYIKNPHAGRSFRIGNVYHSETSLLYWEDDTLADLGIYRVVRQGYDSRRYKCTGYTEVVDGRVITETPILEEDSTYFENHKAVKVVGLSKEVNCYICGRYDLGTQASFQATYVSTADPAVQDALCSVFDWVKLILVYYYDVKEQLLSAADLTALEAITWDFSTFDADDPCVSLEQLMIGS